MARVAPVTNWHPSNEQAIAGSDLNRIEENTRILQQGSGSNTMPTVTPTGSGGNRRLPIDSVNEVFSLSDISESPFISLINSEGRIPGNCITLINNSENASLIQGVAADEDYKPIRHRNIGGSNALVALPYQTIPLVYDGDYWYCGSLA